MSAGHRAAPQPSSAVSQKQRRRQRHTGSRGSGPGGGPQTWLQQDPRPAQPCQVGTSEFKQDTHIRPQRNLWCFLRTLQFENPHPRRSENLAVNTRTCREIDLWPRNREVWVHTKSITRNSNRKKTNLITKVFWTLAPDTELLNACNFLGDRSVLCSNEETLRGSWMGLVTSKCQPQSEA